MLPKLTSLTLTCAFVATSAIAQGFDYAPRNTTFPPAFNNQTRAPLENSDIDLQVTEIASGLDIPWGIAILPDQAGFLVTERDGRLRHITPDGTVSAPITGLPRVATDRQGGLLDIKLAPDFAQSRRIFWTYAKPQSRGRFATAAASGTLSQDLKQVTQATDIFVQTPASPNPMHYGSRILFDAKGRVLITLGEHSSRRERVLAQDLTTTYGKVVRVTQTGQALASNPFTKTQGTNPTIYSYGHRNPQGAVIRNGALWVVEHGPRGGDELNKIEAGKNYGWPVVSYGENYSGSPIGTGKAVQSGMEQPNYFWDPVIAPSDMTVYRGNAFPEWRDDFLIASLNPGGIVRLDMSEDRVVGEERLLMDLGRIRDVDVDTDGNLLAIGDQGALWRITRR